MKTSDTVESVRQSRTHPSHTPTEPADTYQHVYHDDSSTHGSRTLDSRFSRDKYDLSDEQNTDEDEDEHIQKPANGVSHPSPTHVYRSSEPFHVDENDIAQMQHPIDQLIEGKFARWMKRRAHPQPSSSAQKVSLGQVRERKEATTMLFYPFIRAISVMMDGASLRVW